MGKTTRVIAIAAQKGGVGKTATAINLGVALSNLGRKVLLIDCDNHPSLSIRLGIQQPELMEVSLASLLLKSIADEAFEEGEGIQHHSEGVDFITSNASLANVEMMLAGEVGREMFLSNYIDTIRKKYDYILLDRLPSIGLVAINALAAADEVILVTKADFDSAKGMEDLLISISKIKRKLN